VNHLEAKGLCIVFIVFPAAVQRQKVRINEAAERFVASHV
jgi:hypothetical protein